MYNDDFYVCGQDCENCPEFENCFMADDDEELDKRCPKCGKWIYNCRCDIKELEALQNQEGIYDDSDLLDQQFEDRISGCGE